jgi:hypothetical protein
MHIHVGANIPGYLPESDVSCFDSVTDALDALSSDLSDQREFYYEGCDGSGRCGGHPGLGDVTEYCDGSCGNEKCECGWCDVASDVEAAKSAIRDSGPDEHFVAEGRAAWIFSPPEGADIHYWAVSIETDRDSCEIAQEQGD